MTVIGDNTQQQDLEWFLSQRDCPCPRCGYNLRGLRTRSCPECGVALLLSVVRDGRPTGAFWTGVVALSAGMGFYLSFLFLFVISIALGTMDASLIVFAVLFVGVDVFAGFLWVLARSRDRLERQTLTARMLWAGACCAATIGSVPVFYLVMEFVE